MSAQDLKYGEVSAEKAEFHDGEPVFILRAQDPLAPHAIRSYAATCRTADCADEHVEMARDSADVMEQWQRDNPDLVKKRPGPETDENPTETN